MTFIRTIPVKGRNYLALVKNNKVKGKVKQTTVHYYGRDNVTNRLRATYDKIKT